ncbi:DUF3054 domain-containing protein [Nocardioides sp.]|uniref:DUF3054 domain-containing protein n=1 Tax=Nocardioides sp. TaxID=35761 RepID=UPI003516A97A
MWWLPIDVVAVLLFAAVGRSSHEEGLSVPGVLETAGPFLLGLAVAWTALVVVGRPRGWHPADLAPGLLVWIDTVVLGMIARRVAGEGTATSFVVVTTVVLGVLLLGPRLLRRGRRSSRPA